MPDYVQIKYDRVLSDGLPGSNADLNPTYDGCFIAEGDVPYGVVISNASTALRPNMGKVGINNIAATAGYAIGGAPMAQLAALKLVTAGEFKLFVDGAEITVTGVNLSSAANEAAVAAAIQTAIRGVTSGNEVVAVVDGSLKITSGTTGASSQIGPMTSEADDELVGLLGWNTFTAVAGTAAVTAAVMGVVIRNVVDEGGAGNKSNVTVIRDGQIGAYRQDGTIKVLAKENVTARSNVYFDNVTGELYGTTATGRTQLGTAKWVDNCEAGKVGIIDITGLR